MDLSRLAGDVAKKLNRHAPTILTVVAAGGVAATAYLFHQAGAKTASWRHEQEAARDIPVSLDETIQEKWYEYLVPTSIAAATIVCLASANVLNVRRQATLMGAVALVQQTLNRYQEKIREQVGGDVEHLLREEVIRDVAREHFPEVDPNAKGNLFLDVFSGQQFYSDEQTIREAMDATNARCEEEGFASLNYFYDRCGGRTTQLGELMGWSDGFPLDIILTPVTFEDGTQGYGLDYVRMPSLGYFEV